MTHGPDVRAVRMSFFALLLPLAGFLLTGCAQEFKPVVTPSPSPALSTGASASGGSTESGASTASGVPSSASSSASGRLSQCTRELEALKQFNAAKYSSYKSELDRITRTGAQYLAVSGGISQDINDLVQPRYQYALTSLCQRVRADLSASLINQVTIK